MRQRLADECAAASQARQEVLQLQEQLQPFVSATASESGRYSSLLKSKDDVSTRLAEVESRLQVRALMMAGGGGGAVHQDHRQGLRWRLVWLLVLRLR